MQDFFDKTGNCVYNVGEGGGTMSNDKIVQNFTSVFFPFRFSAEQLRAEAFRRPITKSNGKQAQLWEPDPLRSYHLKENVAAMLGRGTDFGTVGQVYVLNDSLRRELNIPEARDRVLFSCRGREEPSAMFLQSVHMSLFCSGIGFLEFTFAYDTADVQEISDLSYFLCEVKSADNFLCYEKRLGRDQRSEQRMTMLELVKKLTDCLGAVEDFDSQAGLHYVDNKPLIFTYLLFQELPADLGALLFRLRTNFKASYQVPAQQLSLENAAGILHPFENVYWGTSLNGVVCCAALTGNTGTDAFFRNTFPSNLRETYLQLYRLRQHQRYAIQNYQRLFVTADEGLETGDAAAVQRAYTRIRSLQSRSTTFHLKCLYMDPSSVEHINAFDRFLEKSLHIQESLADFTENIARLDVIAADAREKIQERKNRQRHAKELRRERTLYIITALWSCVVFLESSWELVENLLNVDLSFQSGWIVLPFAITALPIVEILLQLRRRNQEVHDADDPEDPASERPE